MGDIWDIIIIVLLIFILAYEINLKLVPNEDVRGEELWWGQRFELTPSWFALSIRVSHFGVIFPNHSASGRDLSASH